MQCQLSHECMNVQIIPKLQAQSRSARTLQFTTLDATRGRLRLFATDLVPGTIITAKLPASLCISGDKNLDDNASPSSVTCSVSQSQKHDVTSSKAPTHPFIVAEISIDESGTDPRVKIIGYVGRSYGRAKPDSYAKSTFYQHHVNVGAYHIPVATTAAPPPTHLQLQNIPDGVPITVQQEMWFLAHPVTFFYRNDTCRQSSAFFLSFALTNPH